MAEPPPQCISILKKRVLESLAAPIKYFNSEMKVIFISTQRLLTKTSSINPTSRGVGKYDPPTCLDKEKSSTGNLYHSRKVQVVFQKGYLVCGGFIKLSLSTRTKMILKISLLPDVLICLKYDPDFL